MSEIHTIFWDVGGVLLTNAWDHNERAQALEHFHLDQKEFQARHEMVVSSFERGKITLDEYLDRTIFYTARSFTREEFRDYMFALSRPMTDVLAFGRALAGSGKYFMGTINNESRELNDVPHPENLPCGKSSACLSVPASLGCASRRAVFTVLPSRSLRSIPSNAVSSTIAL